jgi:uncharacterized protein (TIGR01777 family)
MRVLISGSTGLVGTALLDAFRLQGYDLARLVRPATRNPPAVRPRSPEALRLAWDPVAGTLDAAAAGADAVVHLAGASIASGRWTASRKRLLRDSRVSATRHLVQALGQLPKPPKVFVAASAIGFYGDRGDEELTESSPSGSDFLADLCRAWETESERAADVFGARVVNLRLGIVLAGHGGALPLMALPFRLGFGGRLGSGRQWMSWVALEDVVGIVGYVLANHSLSGPVNVVSPNPVRNADFTAALGRVLHRPTLFPATGFALRLALGEMADALLLASQRVLSQKLQTSGYPFSHQSLEPALQSVLRC